MKKAFCIFAAILMISALSSCGKKQEDAGTTAPAVSYASAQEVTAGESSSGTTTEKEPENSNSETVVHTDKTTAATPGTTVAYTGQKEPEKQTKREKPSIRYIRTNESDFDDSIYPKVVFIKSVSELNAYKNSNSSNYYFDSGSGSSESFNDATL
ncbi:MAG: hypothetical protein IK063_03095, partial [Clostridia bacterium]|nr:hypothetical protein [Clostridia bacterium]